MIQRLILTEPLALGVYEEEDKWPHDDEFIFVLKLNNSALISGIESSKVIYLCSVLLILLGCDVSFEGAENLCLYIDAPSFVNELWRMYRQKQLQKDNMKRLQTLCIQKTRQSMVSLTDESFQSLPVPSYIRRLLMLHGVAKVLCEAYQMWPQCIPNEDIM